MTGSDIFIMIPVTGVLRNDIGNIHDSVMDKYLEILEQTENYECDKKIASSIDRKCINKCELAYMSDVYDTEEHQWVACHLVYTFQESTKLGILQIVIPKCPKDDTQIGDIVSSGNLMLKIKDQAVAVNEYIESIDLDICGKIRVIYCNSIKNKQERQLEYLLAGETANSEHADYKISNNAVLDKAKNNLAKYDFYELYASQKSVVYLLNEFKENFVENIGSEALLIFICEIAILQNSAISRINMQIIDELMLNSNISSRKTLKLQVEFGKTILLWDNSVYKYFMAQELSNDIVSAFETNELMEEYRKNSSHIEQIAALKNGIASDIQGKILNFLAFVLSLSELIQLLSGVVAYIKGKEVVVGISGGGILLLILLLALIKNRKNK